MGKKIVLSKDSCIKALEGALEQNKERQKYARLKTSKNAIERTNELFSAIIYHLKVQDHDL